MMKILFKNPFFKIIAVFIVLYFALYSQKDNRRSVLSVFKDDQINKNLEDAKNKALEANEKIKQINQN